MQEVTQYAAKDSIQQERVRGNNSTYRKKQLDIHQKNIQEEGGKKQNY